VSWEPGPRGPDRKPRSRAVPGHAFRESPAGWSCQCGLAGPWPREDYSKAEAVARHRDHKDRHRA
jgi:hypothetical protein